MARLIDPTHMADWLSTLYIIPKYVVTSGIKSSFVCTSRFRAASWLFIYFPVFLWIYFCYISCIFFGY